MKSPRALLTVFTSAVAGQQLFMCSCKEDKTSAYPDRHLEALDVLTYLLTLGMCTQGSTGTCYGLPIRGAVGVTIGGQDIFPVFNTRATLTPQACEVDSCTQHVSGGGGESHLHGDPFGPWCLSIVPDP